MLPTFSEFDGVGKGLGSVLVEILKVGAVLGRIGDQSHLVAPFLDVCGALLLRSLPVTLLAALKDPLGHHMCSGGL